MLRFAKFHGQFSDGFMIMVPIVGVPVKWSIDTLGKFNVFWNISAWCSIFSGGEPGKRGKSLFGLFLSLAQYSSDP